MSWVTDLEIFVVRPRSFNCVYDNTKRSLYSAVNGILGKVLNIASDTAANY